MNKKYIELLEKKSQLYGDYGFEPLWVPDFLFDFQKYLVEWSLKKGRGAIFADCGLGKTPMQLVWAENIVRKTGGRVLILTPLAVCYQTLREAEKFGIEAVRPTGGKLGTINVINYEQLHHFSTSDFEGVVCDESSILKSFDGVRRSEITEFMKKLKYRLLCTATAAPNDFIELGTSSEALGYLGHMDMLNRFFKNNLNNSASRFAGHEAKWRFRGHAEVPFWKWVSSWARAVRKPSDLGFDDAKFILPPLEETEHVVVTDKKPEGMLFNLPAIGLDEQRAERKRTTTERCDKVAELVSRTKEQALVWCHLNVEGDLLERIIPDSVQVSGDDGDDAKENKMMDFASGKTRVLITKPKIGAWGLNFQNCAHITFFPSHSFEQYYQGVRRCWRFGQKRSVHVDIVTTEGERGVSRNLKRKSDQADAMFTQIVSHMRDAIGIGRGSYGDTPEEVPSWLSSTKK